MEDRTSARNGKLAVELSDCLCLLPWVSGYGSRFGAQLRPVRFQRAELGWVTRTGRYPDNQRTETGEEGVVWRGSGEGCPENTADSDGY